jgi:DNA-binding NarL/FixJ family response regulator
MLGSEPGGLILLDVLTSCSRRPPVLLLSSFDEPWMYASALRGGALGYVLKGASLQELMTAIRSVAAGVAVFPAAALRDRYANRLPSPRERDIMRLVADGFGNGEIGGRLGIKEKTVESHLTRLFARYGVGSRTELALLASRQGWIGRRTVGGG